MRTQKRIGDALHAAIRSLADRDQRIEDLEKELAAEKRLSAEYKDQAEFHYAGLSKYFDIAAKYCSDNGVQTEAKLRWIENVIKHAESLAEQLAKAEERASVAEYGLNRLQKQLEQEADDLVGDAQKLGETPLESLTRALLEARAIGAKEEAPTAIPYPDDLSVSVRIGDTWKRFKVQNVSAIEAKLDAVTKEKNAIASDLAAAVRRADRAEAGLRYNMECLARANDYATKYKVGKCGDWIIDVIREDAELLRRRLHAAISELNLYRSLINERANDAL